MTSIPKPGRPTKGDKPKFHESDLHALLVEKLPSEFVHWDRVNVDRLSKVTGKARYTFYRWMKENRISPKGAKLLVTLSAETSETEKKGALTPRDLFPFAFDF